VGFLDDDQVLMLPILFEISEIEAWLVRIEGGKGMAQAQK